MARTLAFAGRGTGRALRIGSSDSVIRPSALLAGALLLSLCASARASPPFCPNSTDGTTTYKSDEATASFLTYGEEYGQCGTCYLSLFASKAVVRSRPGKPTDTVSISLSLSCSEFCIFGGNHFSATYSTADTSGVNIDAKKKKASASVVGTLNLEDYDISPGTPPPPQTASVNVQGNADGVLISVDKCSSGFSYATPCSVITTKSTSGQYSTDFTGTIIVGEKTYNVANVPYSSGYITETDLSTKTVTKTH